MKLIPQERLNKALDKALLKHRPFISEIELFKTELVKLLDHIDESESEEFHKNLVSSFLTNAFYANTHFINTKGRQDLVIHNGKDNKHSVGVIIEAKRPNKGEWFTADKPNGKALQELVLYYLRERIEEKNIDIKYLIATNINEWYIIEASYFDKHFYHNKQLVKQYEEWRDGKKVTKDTGLFYNDIAKPFIDSLTDEIPCTYFNIKNHEKALRSKKAESNREINALFKILSPYHLLKVPFANDSNELDEKFYKELLHIIGLEEAKEGNKNIIRRKIENRNPASLLEKAIEELETEGLHKVTDLKSFGDSNQDQYFSIALELCITWINRILFLKLLEGQLINYHKGDQQYRFLNSGIIPTFSELFILFHRVLAVDIPDRSPNIQQKYKLVPYLNSSLFEISDLEDVTIKINAIDSFQTLDFIGSTILKDHKKKNEKLKTIDYLFQFLDAYDFASEDTGDTRDDNKALINASVLGKVFEKINGYKDGSIYTPGFITMYMSRQSIRLAVLQKFNNANGWGCTDFEGLKEFIEYQQPEARNQANAIINDLKLCDPAVGSGHFLVSALNEIIAIKSELKVLQDINGTRLKAFTIDVINDELSVFDEDDDPFTYNPKNQQSQLVQQTLFTEKQTIIENCLFGVDINPNSVKICRLRLWIELLKNAYYKPDGNLETLPNIDINIKCGNSLLSHFALDADLSKALKSIKYDINAYRGFVNEYKNCKDREVKRGLQLIIDKIKADFRTEIEKNDPLVIKFNKASGELYNLLSQVKLFDDAKTKKVNKTKQEKLEADINKWTKEINEIKNNALYKNAFEWRFEFPEVLNNNGEFEGFDVIIGNPPYGIKFSRSEIKLLKSIYKSFEYQANSYVLFFEKGIEILKDKGFLDYITPATYTYQNYFKKIRSIFKDNLIIRVRKYLYEVFKDADIGDSISILIKRNKSNNSKNIEVHFSHSDKDIIRHVDYCNFFLEDDIFDLNDSAININRQNKEFLPLGDISNIVVGIKPYQVGKGKPFQTKEIGERKVFTSNVQIDETYKLCIIGRDFHRYGFLKSPSMFLKYGKWLAEPRESAPFFETKLILRQTSDSLIAHIDYSQSVNLNNVYNIGGINLDFDIKYILGLLNSKLMNYFYQNISQEKGRLFAEVKKVYLKKLPILNVDHEQQSKITQLVDNILEMKKVGQDTTDLEQQIDALVYQLYDLTPDEIAIVENGTTTKHIEPETEINEVLN
jgi:adenine-specific DNA-methyltransferase